MLDLSIALPIRVQNGGLFISRGVGSHPARRLESWELIFVQQGTLAIRENDVLFEVKAGESLLLWPRRRHVGIGDFPPDLTFYWVHFDVLPATTNPTQLLSLPQHISVSSPQYVMSLFRQFLSEQENRRHGPALEFILLLILQQIASAVGSETHGDNAGVALAYKARKHIRTQYHLPISTSQLARELHCNADYLGRVYRRIFHMTMTEAIHRQRVSAAEKLLISDSLALSEVAQKCGFNDVGYFRQIFRKHTGLTPAAWKRRYCKEHINSD
ncbi:helix-turn-helix domain-containing protein [Citrobacter amalonaticus]|uniref:helix-turn-helix domain-containing protein n=1 Tax=Citrobacter amalonaticus TaxID=35703 RepID=UPI00207C64A6|nr:helix-turn-helix domain-containing protein [Citrobacter amalonaticus]MCO4158561.1 helix-turn-helix domain-containing protein [Citrobacter amalonaticus]